jgi:DMSO/TMAO reductase YedYZ molybdopterin-dependent catalytic subunit
VRTRDPVAGVVAVVAALGAAELLAGVLLAVPSLVDAVGQAMIPRFPGPVTTWAIDTFGTANRAVLVAGTVAVALAIGAGLGAAARRRSSVGPAGFALAGAVGALAASADPAASSLGVWVVAAVAATVGAVTLRRLLGTADATPPSAVASDAPSGPLHSRRSVLAAAGVVSASVVAVAVGRYALAGRAARVDPSAVDLPTPARALPAPGSDQAWVAPAGLSPVRTPTDGFFRIDTALRVPQVDPDTWELRVLGLVEREVVLTYDDLLALPLEEVDITLQCVSNEVGGDLVGTARWTGIRLADLLDRAGPTAGAEQVLGRSVDGFDAGFPIEAAYDRDAIVALAMNGEPLPTRHGFPARLVVPGLYGYVSATKWLAAIELAPWDGVDGYWVPRGWAKEGPVKTSSRIDVPAAGASIAPGPTTVAGVAWAPLRGVERVEVQVDDGPWQEADRSTPLSAATWVQWRVTVDLPPGERRLRVRAVDGTGQQQAEGPRPPAPDGAEGWHTAVVRSG